MTREQRSIRRRERIERRRLAIRNKREHLLEERDARRREKSSFWRDSFEVVGIFVLGILEVLG